MTRFREIAIRHTTRKFQVRATKATKESTVQHHPGTKSCKTCFVSFYMVQHHASLLANGNQGYQGYQGIHGSAPEVSHGS